jgi:hypothetical protein
MVSGRFQSGVSSTRMQVLHVGDGLATGAIDNVLVLVWRGPVNAERFRLKREALRAMARKHRGQTAIVCVVEPSSDPPSEELKAATRDLLVEHEQDLLSVSYVIEGDGFRAAMIRAGLSTVQLLLGRRRFTTRFFRTVVEACAFTEQHTVTPFEVMSEAVEELRALLDSEENVTLIRSRADLF